MVCGLAKGRWTKGTELLQDEGVSMHARTLTLRRKPR